MRGRLASHRNPLRNGSRSGARGRMFQAGTAVGTVPQLEEGETARHLRRAALAAVAAVAAVVGAAAAVAAAVAGGGRRGRRTRSRGLQMLNPSHHRRGAPGKQRGKAPRAAFGATQGALARRARRQQATRDPDPPPALPSGRRVARLADGAEVDVGEPGPGRMRLRTVKISRLVHIAFNFRYMSINEIARETRKKPPGAARDRKRRATVLLSVFDKHLCVASTGPHGPN